jgi:hypothetical protein
MGVNAVSFGVPLYLDLRNKEHSFILASIHLYKFCSLKL